MPKVAGAWAKLGNCHMSASAINPSESGLSATHPRLCENSILPQVARMLFHDRVSEAEIPRDLRCISWRECPNGAESDETYASPGNRILTRGFLAEFSHALHPKAVKLD